MRRLEKIFLALLCLSVGLSLWGAIAQTRFPELTLAHDLLLVGILLFMAMLFAGGLLGFCENAWLRRLARSEIKQRSGLLVNPDAPGVLFVEIVPTSNWGENFSGETATDVGFLQIDTVRGELRFEGDNLRYRIPAGAIAKCRQDSYSRFISGNDAPRLVYFHFVIITIQVSSGQTVDLPVGFRRSLLQTAAGARTANFELYQRISAFRRAAKPGRRQERTA